ncbi:MAG: lysylphosphatidylglycerol synthase transmembrane domain-containing protein [Thermodesulfobacteriota bacterium]
MPLNRKTGVFLIKVLVSISLLVFLFWKTDMDLFLKTASSLDIRLFITAAILYIGCQYVSSFRWKVLLLAHNITVSTPRLFSFYLVGMFFNNFLPGSIGGDVVKGYDFYRHSRRGKESATTVFLERYVGLVALFIIGLTALVFLYPLLEDPIIVILMLSIFIVFIIGTIVVVNSSVKNLTINIVNRFKITKLEKAISGIYETVGRYNNHKNSVFNAFLLSVIIQLMNIVVYITLSDALNIIVPWGHFFLFFPIITIISMLPISLNGLGVREGINIYLFSQVGVESPQALTLSLTWFFMVIFISVPGGIIFAFRK